MLFAYPAEVAEEADGVTVTFPDVPEAITSGATMAEALAQAEDALVSALSFYVDDGRALPKPSAVRGRPVVSVPMLEAAKLALHEAMLATRVSNIELSRRLGIDEKSVRRLRDPIHRSHIGQVEAALRQLGKRMEISVRDAA